MIDAKLYEKAIMLRHSVLWDELLIDDIFAVEFSDSTIGYVMMDDGVNNDNFEPGDPLEMSLYLYTGDNGLRSMRAMYEQYAEEEDLRLFRDTPENPEKPRCDHDEEEQLRYAADRILRDNTTFTSQECLMLCFSGRDMLTKDEYGMVAETAKRLGVSKKKMGGLYPCFYSIRKGRPPKPDLTEDEQKIMSEALDRVLELSMAVKERTYDIGEFYDLFDERKFPLVRQDSTFASTEVPAVPECSYSGIIRDASPLEKLRKLRKTDTLQCVALRMPEPVVEDYDTDVPGEAFFPMTALVFSESTSRIFPPVSLKQADEGFCEYEMDDLVSLIT